MKQKHSITIASLLALTGLVVFASCSGGSGDTDGGASTSSSGTGSQFVSDGAAGSNMRIELERAETIPTGGKVNFLITATDPNGAPLSYIRINCETEHGISIIEPSRGGVAFETTNSEGKMSGVFGGLTPGSFLVECRGPQGYNLVVRKTYKVVGEIPEGFDGFPGAAGGNLGGGVIVEPPSGEDVTLTEITFSSVSGDGGRVGNIDNSQDADCDNDGNNPVAIPADPTATPPIAAVPRGTFDPETFGPDSYIITINNQRDQRVFVQSIQFEVNLGSSSVSSLRQLGGLVIQPNGSVDLQGVFTQNTSQTELTLVDKYFSGTNTFTPDGTYNVVFTVTMVDGNGETIIVRQAAAVIIQNFDNC